MIRRNGDVPQCSLDRIAQVTGAATGH